MKLVRYGKPGKERPGLIDHKGKLRDCSDLVDDFIGEALSHKSLKKIAKAAKSGDLPAVHGKPRIGACIARPTNFIGVGLNYVDHAGEVGMELPKEPILFNKAPNCIIGPNDAIIRPKGATKLDWEVELGVVIGKRASYIEASDVDAHIAGYCLANDVSERSFQLERGGNWMKGKSAPTFGPLGPWLVTPDEIADVQNLGMWLDINGERMQTGVTANMIFDVKTIISYISQFMTLEVGDVIVTGTPAGVGMSKNPQRFLQPGDTIRLSIDKLGEQAACIVDPGDEEA